MQAQHTELALYFMGQFHESISTPLETAMQILDELCTNKNAPVIV